MCVGARFERPGPGARDRALRCFPLAHPWPPLVDNYHTHKHDDIQPVAGQPPRVKLHFPSTSGSWLNLVELFFRIITRQAIRRDTFADVKGLTTAVGQFIDS